MRYLRRYISLVFLAVMGTCISISASNSFPMQVPDFQLTRNDGSTLSTTQIPQSGKWLFVYLKQNCAGCERFLRIFSKAENPALPPHIVVVIAGLPADKIDTWVSRFPDLAQAQWYADPGQGGLTALQIKGSPIVFGAQDKTLNWSIVGVPAGDSARLKAVFKSWVTP